MKKKRMFELNSACEKAIEILENKGFQSYLVGGCVRDLLMQKQPFDWDLCTDAKPPETIACFSDFNVITTGLKHGTVTVLIDALPLEITTFRSDGSYADGRRPNSVQFLSNLIDDLKRRDFTINAMAYHPKTGVIDPFDGQLDLEKKIIRCVGEPDLRFMEDGLRIMRAMRFAAVLGFAIEDNTKAEMFRQADILKRISVERISAELNRLLLGEYVEPVLTHFRNIFTIILPELFADNDEATFVKQEFDHWTQIGTAIAIAPPELVLRLALLLQKPLSHKRYSLLENPQSPAKMDQSVKIVSQILQRLRYPKKTIAAVLPLISHIDIPIAPERKTIKRRLRSLGTENFQRLLEAKKANLLTPDLLAENGSNQNLSNEKTSITMATQNTLQLIETVETLKILQEVTQISEDIQRNHECYSLKNLAVNGNDLIQLGVSPGKENGRILEALLDAVIEETLPNEKAALLKAAPHII